MKKLLALLLILVLSFSLVACGEKPAENNEGGEDAPEERSLTIGFCMAGLYTLPGHYNALLKVKEYADEHGYKVVEASLDSADDVPKIAENFISSGCDVVLFHGLYGEALEAQIPAMVDAGICVASIDADLRSAGAQFTEYCDNYLSGYTIGTAAAEWAEKNIEGTVYVGCLNYNPVERFAERGKGEMQALKDKLGDRCVIVSELDAGLAEQGMAQAEDMLSAHPEINLMICWNGTSGIGAYEALKAAGWNGQPDKGLFDIDAGSDALAAMMEEGSCFRASLDMNLIDGLSGIVFKMCDYVLAGNQYPEGTDESYYAYPYATKPIWADMAPEQIKLYQ